MISFSSIVHSVFDFIHCLHSVTLRCRSPYNSIYVQWWRRVFYPCRDRIAGCVCWCRACGIRLHCRAIRPFSGRIADELFDTVDKVCKFGAVPPHALRSMIMSFIAFFLFWLLYCYSANKLLCSPLPYLSSAKVNPRKHRCKKWGKAGK